jgi:hypothetical protein
MKTPSQSESFNPPVRTIPPFCVSLITVMLVWTASASAQQKNAQPPTAVAAPADASPATNPSPATALSPGVSGVLKLADADVSGEVLKTYVESSPTAFQLTEADIIALKQHHVADDIVTLLLKRSAEVRSAIAKARQDAGVRATSERRLAAGGFDPDSYEYFQYYYLQPRALAAAQQRLQPHYYGGLPYAYGYPPAFVYGPGFPGRPTHLRHHGPPRSWRY